MHARNRLAASSFLSLVAEPQKSAQLRQRK
jgi:hypothetical protein